MTYKYFFIRREMYEKKVNQKLQKGRTFSQILRLYKAPYIIILALLFASILSVIIMLLLGFSDVFILIPMALLVLAFVLFEVPHEDKIYNISEREHEIAERIDDYNEYIRLAGDVLKKYGINTAEKFELLKKECLSQIDKYSNHFSNLNSKIVDMFIGVPLGALIAIVIENNNETRIKSILTIIIIGSSLYMIIKVISIILGISETVFKDKYLLDVLTDLEYENSNYTGQS